MEENRYTYRKGDKIRFKNVSRYSDDDLLLEDWHLVSDAEHICKELGLNYASRCTIPKDKNEGIVAHDQRDEDGGVLITFEQGDKKGQGTLLFLPESLELIESTTNSFPIY